MKRWIVGLVAGLFLFAGTAFGGYRYSVKVEHAGGNVTPSQAYEMVKADPAHTFIVDTRTRAEYQLIGHPVGAYHIPKKIWTGKLGEKKFGHVCIERLTKRS